MLGTIYLAVVSVVCAVFGFVLLWRRIALFLSGGRTSGSFVRWHESGLRRKSYAPVVRFVGRDGVEREFVGGPAATRVKERPYYPVIYPLQEPEKAMVYTFLAYWAAPLAFFILAAGAAVAAWQQ
jgi:hypothetical protein